MMNNPYSNEWGKINKLAKDIRTLLDKIEELRAKAAKIQEQIARIPYKEDENGNDVNAEKRNALYAQLESVNALIADINERRSQLSAEAIQLSNSYQSQARAYEGKAKKAAGAKSGFDRLSGYRFGASTAASAANVSGQREEHYQSFVRILQELSSAAQSAANGILVGKGTQTVSDRGTFVNPNRAGLGNFAEGQNHSRQGGWKGTPGDSIKTTNNSENGALFSGLNMEGLPYQGGNPNFASVSHAVVPIAGAGIPTMVAADAMLAKRYGIAANEIAEYRKENGLEWRNDGSGTEYLVPIAISEEYNEGRAEEIQPSAPDALTAYLWAHNYGPDDFNTYSQDPEWRRLMSAAHPEYELPPLSKESAFGQLQDYMNAHNYGPDDFEIYSQDPEWRSLHKQAFPDYEMPPRNKADNVGKWDDIPADISAKANIDAANPNYYSGDEWKVNCQRCVPTYEMRSRGYDVTSQPCIDDNDDLSYNPFDVWEQPDIRTCNGNGMEDIQKQMAEWGDGARSQVVVLWKNGYGGHTFTAVQHNGSTHFVDPQNGDMDVSWYFNEASNGGTQFCRIDKLQPSNRILDCCSKRRSE